MLPAELRQIIYEFVFTPPFEDGSAKSLALLATCRLVNQEAIHLALRQCIFTIDTNRNPILRPGLWALGPLQQHLRHIHIYMPSEKLDHAGKNNPFLLMELPLKHLKVGIHIKYGVEKKDFLGRTIQEHVEDNWFKLVSALFYRTSPGIGEDGWASIPYTRQICSDQMLRAQRRSEVQSWSFRPNVGDLSNMWFHCRAEKVEILNNDLGFFNLWSAFRHVGILRYRQSGIQSLEIKDEVNRDTGTRIQRRSHKSFQFSRLDDMVEVLTLSSTELASVTEDEDILNGLDPNTLAPL
jgi:hypothetical protein